MYFLIDRPVMTARNSYYSESFGRQLRLFAYANISVGICFRHYPVVHIAIDNRQLKKGV